MRRRYITHPRFQFWFVFAYVRGALISVAGGAILLLVALYALAHDPSLQPEQVIRITNFMTTIEIILGVSAGVVTVLFTLLGIYLSYKMAGPIRRLEDWLIQKNTADHVPPLHLRPGDEWIPVVSLLNKMGDKP